MRSTTWKSGVGDGEGNRRAQVFEFLQFGPAIQTRTLRKDTVVPTD